MALRLVTPVDGPATPPSTPAAPPGVTLRALRQRADGLLQAREFGRWQEAMAETAALPDIHERYVARRVLLESLLAIRGIGGRAMAEAFAAGADAVLTLLEDEPREPIFLNTAGVLLYELGAIVGAEALFRAAQRLDPELEHLAGNLRECKRRRKAGTSLAGLPPQVLRALRTLVPRAQRVAVRAMPATGLTLSLCMIVKDEEEMLPRCLAAIRDHVDEIIVVDTGSTDRTVQIAEEFGATVLHHTWTGDFSAARNVSFDAATGDWMMFLDADEVLVEGDGPRLRALTGKVWREGLFLVETNYTGEIEDGTSVNHNALRVFRNRPQYRFSGRIHEQIANRLPDLPERLEVANVRVEHFGYLGVVRDAKEKSRRNIELLEQQVREGGDNPFLHFNIGSEYGAGLDPVRALEHFRIAWGKLVDDPERVRFGFYPSLCARFVKALHLNGFREEALEVGDQVLRELPGFTDVIFEQSWARRALGDIEGARAGFERCLEMGDAPSRYSAAVGAGTFLAFAALSDLHEHTGDHAAAAAALRRCLEIHPGFVGAVEPFARALLRTGVPPAAVAAEVGELVADLSPNARFLLAVALYEAGAVVEAEAELRAVLAARPGSDPARVALGEALLSQGRLGEAAQEALRVEASTALGAAAARTALFARIADAGAGEDAIDAALHHAVRAGLPTAERALFSAWRTGDTRPDTLGPDAAPLLAVMLDALARLEAFDAFERLAGVVDAVALPWRERRQLLAEVYLRRGFVASAADEWIAVVQREGADARAMLGLAAVAEARGLVEDAAVLRAEAEQLAAA